MKITLHLNGSASALAAFLATVPENLIDGTATAPASTPVPQPVAIPPMPALSGDDGEDDGPVNSAAPATDASGMPWDARIHASTKGTNEDGTWRKKRKVDATLVAAVEAELRGNAAPVATPMPAPVAVPQPVPMPTAIPMTAVMPAPVAAVAAPAPVAMPAPMPAPVAAPMPAPVPAPMPVAEPVAAVAAPAPVAEGIDFTGFMAHLTSKMQTQQITSDDLVALVQQINAAWTPHGHAPLGAITDLQNDPAKLTYAVQVLQGQGKW